MRIRFRYIGKDNEVFKFGRCYTIQIRGLLLSSEGYDFTYESFEEFFENWAQLKPGD